MIKIYVLTVLLNLIINLKDQCHETILGCDRNLVTNKNSQGLTSISTSLMTILSKMIKNHGHGLARLNSLSITLGEPCWTQIVRLDYYTSRRLSCIIIAQILCYTKLHKLSHKSCPFNLKQASLLLSKQRYCLMVSPSNNCSSCQAQ